MATPGALVRELKKALASKLGVVNVVGDTCHLSRVGTDRVRVGMKILTSVKYMSMN